MPIDKKLLEILACPKCKGDLKLKEDESGFICEQCKLLYPIKDDIPIMLIEEAINIEQMQQADYCYNAVSFGGGGLQSPTFAIISKKL